MNNYNYIATDGKEWYYCERLGLYFSNPNFVGIGYTLDQLERFDSERE